MSKNIDLITDSIYDIIDTLEYASNHTVSLVLEMEDQMVNNQLYDYVSLGDGILAVEHHLFDVSSVNYLAQGIFYMVPIQVGHNVFIRYKKCLKTFNTLRHPNTTSIPKQYKRKVLSSEKADMNKISITLLLDGLKPQLLNHYSVVFVHKAYPNLTNPTQGKYIKFSIDLFTFQPP